MTTRRGKVQNDWHLVTTLIVSLKFASCELVTRNSSNAWKIPVVSTDTRFEPLMAGVGENNII